MERGAIGIGSGIERGIGIERRVIVLAVVVVPRSANGGTGKIPIPIRIPTPTPIIPARTRVHGGMDTHRRLWACLCAVLLLLPCRMVAGEEGGKETTGTRTRILIRRTGMAQVGRCRRGWVCDQTLSFLLPGISFVRSFVLVLFLFSLRLLSVVVLGSSACFKFPRLISCHPFHYPRARARDILYTIPIRYFVDIRWPAHIYPIPFHPQLNCNIPPIRPRSPKAPAIYPCPCPWSLSPIFFATCNITINT